MGGMTVGNRLAVVRGAPLSQPSKLGFTARLAYFNQARPSIDFDRKYGPKGNISIKGWFSGPIDLMSMLSFGDECSG